MRAIYLRKESGNIIRKIMIDMAYLVSHKQIRLPKYYFENGLFFIYKTGNGNSEKYYLTKDNIISEDKDHYFFDFKFKPGEVEEFSG